jgi:exopolyphosphatase/guanosine-5'-triphosphate,3'-diphosphate pyrophosphatase
MLKFAGFILVFSLSTSIYALENNCSVVRAAFDLGSGKTKMVVAKVNKCLNKIEDIVLEESMALEVKEVSDKNNKTIPVEFEEIAIAKIAELKKHAEAKHAEEYLGVATEVYRKTTNGSDYINRINSTLNLNIRIISQDEETKIGQQSVKNIAHLNQNILVWDIGGGSMQISTIGFLENNFEEKDFFYKGTLASVPFKKLIIEQLMLQDSKSVNSPNPMGEELLNESVKAAFDYAKSHLNLALQDHANIKNLNTIGIGGVLKGISDLVGSKFVTQENLYSALVKNCNLTDAEINSPYASTTISNGALVLGFMKAMNINSIQVLVVNLGHGIIIE